MDLSQQLQAFFLLVAVTVRSPGTLIPIILTCLLTDCISSEHPFLGDAVHRVRCQSDTNERL